jgi:hypothetical protein
MQAVKVKDGDSFKIINREDYREKEHELYDDESKAIIGNETEEEREARRKLEAEHRAQANRGIPGMPASVDGSRNPSGTFSEPTPTDIRYPNVNATEFENNHGAFVNKSADDLRREQGLEDKPGGVMPEVKERVEETEAAKAAAAAAASKEERQKVQERNANAGNSSKKKADIDGMTVAELRKYADKNKIDISGANRKDEIVSAIKSAEEEKDKASASAEA